MVPRTSDASVDRWQLLIAAALVAADEDPTVRFAQLATVSPDGTPYNRTVVVRAFYSETDVLHIVTDARSQKVTHLRADARASLCWYLTAARQQFRFRGTVALVDAAADAEAQQARRSAWSALSARTRRQFAWPAPGTPKTAESSDAEEPPADDPPETFVLLRFHPSFVDHLVLTSTPHRRTLYHLDDAGVWQRQPVNP